MIKVLALELGKRTLNFDEFLDAMKIFSYSAEPGLKKQFLYKVADTHLKGTLTRKEFVDFFQEKFLSR